MKFITKIFSTIGDFFSYIGFASIIALIGSALSGLVDLVSNADSIDIDIS